MLTAALRSHTWTKQLQVSPNYMDLLLQPGLLLFGTESLQTKRGRSRTMLKTRNVPCAWNIHALFQVGIGMESVMENVEL